jgi:hypothetical protein
MPMTREQQQNITFGMACVMGVIWLGFVGWTIVRDIQGRREAHASIERLEKLAKGARVMRGGDGATIITPAPSDS